MIRPEIMRMVLQETSIRLKIKIMLQAGYTYDTIQATLGCSPKTISAVKKLLDSNEMVLPLKTGPKIKINDEVKNIVLAENFANPSLNLRSLSLAKFISSGNRAHFLKRIVQIYSENKLN
ncbi:hypothetical protein M9Y10_022922 [Tritrichomonas musculus]|uniref:Uncharacterized protein n=1 Tax=Tritrichomonas musculus TaxID=1915356 RepID=A0ABR2KTQ3_9EUKA